MKSGITDVQTTLEYAQSHDLALKMLPIALAGAVIGLFLMTPLDGSDIEHRNGLSGGLLLAISLIFLAVIIRRRMQPSVPGIVLSPQGLLFRDISAKIIPWNEILDVGEDYVSAARDFRSTKVTRIIVSPRFYDVLTAGAVQESLVGVGGDPSHIYLSYYHALPFVEFQAAIRHRWHAFSRHATGTPPPVGAPALAETPSPSLSRRAVAIQRAPAFEGLRAASALIRASSPGQLIVIAGLLAALGALITNQMGLWSTPGQERGRATAAEWRAWSEKYDAERSALDAEQARTRDFWDRKFECMDEYWALHENGTYTKDPSCMKDGK